jgi:hypothetical protein
MTSDKEPNYDVAISFLARDEATAKALADQLEAGGLKVFFFPRRQKDLAGTNGMETMRAPFLEARVVVILFKEPWGKTPWTGVEQTAITERCLAGGWPSLMFVQLDKTSAIPRWLPTTHIRFSFPDYGLDQLVGAIKARVQEHGGRVTPPDAMSEARRVQRERQYLADREGLMSDQRWIGTVVHPSVQQTMTELVRLAGEVNKNHSFQIQAGEGDKTCVLRSGYVSMAVGWRQPFLNRVSDHGSNKCYLRAGEFSGTVFLPGERGIIIYRPKPLKEHRFKVEVAQDRKLVWVEDGKKEHIHPDRLADHIMRYFLDLISRADQGKVARPEL